MLELSTKIAQVNTSTEIIRHCLSSFEPKAERKLAVDAIDKHNFYMHRILNKKDSMHNVSRLNIAKLGNVQA